LDKQKSYNKADSLEPDSKVLRLTKILSDMDEALNATLHPRKTKYVFEGLAHLAARILIMAANYMETIDTAGIQRMCRNANAMQQTLSSITASREVSLDQARSFYEMFYMNPDVRTTNMWFVVVVMSVWLLFCRTFSTASSRRVHNSPKCNI
jgi:exocyst complex component 4